MILDTCALLWLAHEQERLSPEVLRMLEEAPAVYLSSITGFEIALKCRSGKLMLPVPASRWLPEIIAHHRISLLGLDMDICLRAAELPPIHKDPCDRFIIATALAQRLRVVTADERFAQYGVEVLL